MVKLNNWRFREYIEGFLIAEGNVIGHAKMTDGTYVRTSLIKSVIECSKGDELVFVTCSGTNYKVSWDEADVKYLEETKNALINFRIMTS